MKRISDKERLEFILWVLKMSEFRGLYSRQAIDAAIRADRQRKGKR